MKPSARPAPRGVTLIIVLMALIGLALASVALVRGIDQGSRIAGKKDEKETRGLDMVEAKYIDLLLRYTLGKDYNIAGCSL